MRSKLRYLCTSLWLGAIALAGMLGPAMAACNVEASGGLGLRSDHLSSSGSSIDLSGVGAIGGLGAGCDTAIVGSTGASIGVMARYSLMHVVGDVGSASLQSDRLWEAAAKVSYKWHDKYAFYARAGWAGMNLDLPSGLGNKQPNGLLLSGGVSTHIRDGWWGGLEYSWYDFNKQSLGSSESLTPDLHVVRVVLTYQFGAPAAAPLK